MNWLLLSTIGCSLFVLFTSSGTEKSSIRKTFLGIFLFPSASFCLMLKNQDRLLSLLEGAIPCGFYETLKAHYAPEFIIFLYGSISLASIYFCLDLSLARDWSSRRWNLFFVLMTLTFILLSLLLKVFDSGFKSVLLRLISFVSHFSYDKGRKQSTQSRHCSTEKIYRSWEFCPDEKQTKEDKTCAYQQPFYQCCFHLDFLRGLNRYLSLQTKFYSYPRRPLFLGALGKVKALLAPRACLKTMLLQAFTSRFIAWSQYLCIAKFSSHLFRTRSGRIGQRRCFLFSKKNARSRIEVANCLGLLINNAFIAQCREGSHRKPSYVKKGKAPYCDTRSTRLSFILFLNLFRKLHNNSARFLHDQGSTRRGARLFSRSTRNNCRPDYIGIQKISQGLRGISRHKEIRFILFLRGLISNLSLATKFYSSPRRPPSIVF